MVHLCAHAYGGPTRAAVILKCRGVSDVYPACFPVCSVAPCRQAAATHSTFVPAYGSLFTYRGPPGSTWLRSFQHWAWPSCRRGAFMTICLTRHSVGGATGWTQYLSRRCPPVQPSTRSLCRPSTLCATPTYSTCWSPTATTPCSQVGSPVSPPAHSAVVACQSACQL